MAKVVVVTINHNDHQALDMAMALQANRSNREGIIVAEKPAPHLIYKCRNANYFVQSPYYPCKCKGCKKSAADNSKFCKQHQWMRK